MTIYIFVFLISALCLYCKERSKGFLSLILASAGIAVPCLLAAFRDKSVGTDVTVYGTIVYRDTKNIGLLEAIELRSENPPGFVSLAWFINLINGSFELYLFVIELLIILPAYFSISYFLKKDTWIGMLIYYFLLYAISLNLMKQMIAVSFTALALSFVLKKQQMSWLVCSIIAVLMHQTGILSFLVYPIYLIFSKASSYFLIRRFLVYFLTFGFIVVLVVFSNNFLMFLSGLKDSYSYMIENRGNGGLLLSPLIFLGFIILLHFADYVIHGSKQKICQFLENRDSHFIEYLSVLGLALMELQIITLGLGRVGYYFEFYLSILIVYRIKENNLILKLFSVIFMITVFLVQIKFVLDGNCEVYPYSSSILGIN